MRARLAVLLLCAALVLPAAGVAQPGSAPAPTAQNATLEVSQVTLNGLIGRLGSLANAGLHQPAGGGAPVPWQWTVTNAAFTLAEGAMTFTATVNAVVGGQPSTETRTVPASVSFDAASHRLRINVGTFAVPVQVGGAVITQVDVARLYSVSTPIEAQELTLSLPDGGTRTLIARLVSATPQYLPGKLVITVDLGFAPPAPVFRLARAADVGLAGSDLGSLVPTGRGVLKVYESAFNELADKVEPIQFKGHYAYKACTWTPFGTQCTTICSSDWTAKVKDLRFGISPARVRITGDVEAHWCNVGFNANLETSADVRAVTTLVVVPQLHPSHGQPAPGRFQGQTAIRVTVEPTSIQPVFRVSGYEVALPIHINVAPSLTLPPLPVSTASFHFETAEGPRALRLSPTHLAVVKRNGYVELQANVSLW